MLAVENEQTLIRYFYAANSPPKEEKRFMFKQVALDDASTRVKVRDSEEEARSPIVRIAYAPQIAELLRSYADEEAAEKAKPVAVKPARRPYGLD